MGAGGLESRDEEGGRRVCVYLGSTEFLSTR